MGAKKKASGGVPSNEIWYTSTDGNIVTPSYTNVFGVAIKSNTYTDGKGVITLEGDVTTIGYYAFSGRTNLASIALPDGVITIEGQTFRDCTSLASITIPKGVTTIGGIVCYNCPSLKSVYCKPTTPPAGGPNMFYYNAPGRKIYVPAGSVDAYKAAKYWSDYAADIVEEA